MTNLSQTVPGPMGPGPHFSIHFSSLYRPGWPHARHIRCPSSLVAGYILAGTAETSVVEVMRVSLRVRLFALAFELLAERCPVLVYFVLLIGAPVTTGAKMCVWNEPVDGRTVPAMGDMEDTEGLSEGGCGNGSVL